jgi:hypothetical protein
MRWYFLSRGTLATGSGPGRAGKAMLADNNIAAFKPGHIKRTDMLACLFVYF